MIADAFRMFPVVFAAIVVLIVLRGRAIDTDDLRIIGVSLTAAIAAGIGLIVAAFLIGAAIATGLNAFDMIRR